MENTEFAKSKAFLIAETLEYVAHSVVSKTIIRKITGNVSAVAFDAGETLTGKVSPFDIFIQVMEGKAEVVIDDQHNQLGTGQFIIIPAHSRNYIKASERFKMLSTVIKSGYEELG